MAGSQKTIDLASVGQVTLKKFKQSKRISIKIKQTGEVLVTMPLSVSYTAALDFVHEQTDWILSHKKKAKNLKADTPLIGDGFNFPFFTVRFKRVTKGAARISYAQKVLWFQISEEVDVTSDTFQNLAKKSAIEVLRFEAQKRLPQMVERLAKQHGFSYSGVKINKAKTRWGICSGRRDINLSCYLMLVPDDLIEYVILHELCHTLEMNHSHRFYKLMDKVTDGQTMVLKQRLKGEGLKWRFLKT